MIASLGTSGTVTGTTGEKREEKASEGWEGTRSHSLEAQA